MRHMPTIIRQVRRSSQQAGLFVLWRAYWRPVA